MPSVIVICTLRPALTAPVGLNIAVGVGRGGLRGSGRAWVVSESVVMEGEGVVSGSVVVAAVAGPVVGSVVGVIGVGVPAVAGPGNTVGTSSCSVWHSLIIDRCISLADLYRSEPRVAGLGLDCVRVSGEVGIRASISFVKIMSLVTAR